jgi:hypothetical protein
MELYLYSPYGVEKENLIFPTLTKSKVLFNPFKPSFLFMFTALRITERHTCYTPNTTAWLLTATELKSNAFGCILRVHCAYCNSGETLQITGLYSHPPLDFWATEILLHYESKHLCFNYHLGYALW